MLPANTKREKNELDLAANEIDTKNWLNKSVTGPKLDPDRLPTLCIYQRTLDIYS